MVTATEPPDCTEFGVIEDTETSGDCSLIVAEVVTAVESTTPSFTTRVTVKIPVVV